MAATCSCGDESEKLMYPYTFGHVATRIYMPWGTNNTSIVQQQRKQLLSWFIVDRKISDKNLEQQTKVIFRVTTGKSLVKRQS
jgi:hypothetical protein